MNASLVDNIVRATLYEGYILYPYRPSSVKNRQRWTFGGIYPKPFSDAQRGTDPCMMQTQCIVQGDSPTVRITLRFLHLSERREVGRQPWQEAVERDVNVKDVDLIDASRRIQFSFPASREITDGGIREQHAISGLVEISSERQSQDVFLLTIRVHNTTPLDTINRDAALLRAFASTHLVLTAARGQFISMTDPPKSIKEIAATCHNVGCWPVLVGEPGDASTLLASPIILEDYPRIASQSPGDLFDGTEIDEILTLRILTLTDDEKNEAVTSDGRAAELFARTESLARQQLMDLHGVMRHA